MMFPGSGRRARGRALMFLMAMAAFGAVLSTPGVAEANTYRWAKVEQGEVVGGEWNVPGNWVLTAGNSPGDAFPNRPGDVADFPLFAAQAYTITVPTDIVVGLIQVGGGSSVIIEGVGGTLTLDSGDAAQKATLQNLNNTGLTLNVQLQLRSDLSVLTFDAAAVKFERAIDQPTDRVHSITKSGAGVATLLRPAFHTGGTTVAEGELILQSPNGASLVHAATLQVGDGTGAPDSARVFVAFATQFSSQASVQVKRDGVLRVSQPNRVGQMVIMDGSVFAIRQFTIAGLDMTGGMLEVGNEGVVLEGDVLATAGAAGPAVIESTPQGFLDMLTATRTFTVIDGPGAIELDMRASVRGSGAGLIKDGEGVLRFTEGGHNTYSGETLVRRGRVELARGVGTQTVPAGLRVGVGLGSAVVSIENSGGINQGSSVVVGAGGLVLSNGGDRTVTALTIGTGGRVVTGDLASDVWRTSALTIAGGGRLTLARDSINSGFVLNGPLLVLPSPAGPAVIDGAGGLDLGDATVLFVQDGPQAVALRVDARTFHGENFNAPPLAKRGAGVAMFTGQGNHERGTAVFEGTLLVTGTQIGGGIVVDGGGTLGGTGTVREVSVFTGTISPGLSPGRFSTGSVVLSAGATFAVELNGPTAGSAYDRLAVTGTVNLGNAALRLTAIAGLSRSATFTIVDNDGVDPIVGTFAGHVEGSTVTIGGTPFTLSYRGGDGNDVVLTGPAGPEPEPSPEPDPTRVTYFLAEGATGTFFDDDVLIANPNDASAPVTLTFLQAGGATVVEKRTLPPQSRMTLHVDQIAGLAETSASVQVESDNRLPLVVERTMFWNESYYGGHTATAVTKPETRWIFAEGSQGSFFNTYILIANTNAAATTATLTFLRENGPPVVHTVPIGPFARETIYAGDVPTLEGAFGIVVEAPLPLIAERAMYFATQPDRRWAGGHVNTGIAAPSTSWFHAEGATGTFFNTFILLSNPQDTEAKVDLRFLLASGEVITRPKTLEPRQRLTVNPAFENDVRLENAAMSTVVQSDVPIVSERSMYWNEDQTPVGEGHNSSGAIGTATRWGLAEGRVGGPHAFVTYILLANPSTTAAEVTISYLRESGTPIVKTYTVPPTSRYNVDVNSVVPELQDASFGARIEVTNSVPVVVERSMYWDAGGVQWAGGTNALATPLP
jgi:autotransporter-associated beta strand protein